MLLARFPAVFARRVRKWPLRRVTDRLEHASHSRLFWQLLETERAVHAQRISEAGFEGLQSNFLKYWTLITHRFVQPSLSNPKASGVGLTVEEHLNCECGCPLTAQDCGPDQDLDEANCRCTFTGTHRPHPCETEIVCQRSGSLEFGLTEIRLEKAVTNICYPQPTVVRLHPNSSSLEDDDHRMVIVPAGVRVNRCVGCCEAPWQCVPTGYAQRSFQVITRSRPLTALT